jgi:hypothetical protein
LKTLLITENLFHARSGLQDRPDYPVIAKLARKMLKMDPMEGRFAPTPQM